MQDLVGAVWAVRIRARPRSVRLAQAVLAGGAVLEVLSFAGGALAGGLQETWLLGLVGLCFLPYYLLLLFVRLLPAVSLLLVYSGARLALLPGLAGSVAAGYVLGDGVARAGLLLGLLYVYRAYEKEQGRGAGEEETQDGSEHE
jgi:hypothetical protein